MRYLDELMALYPDASRSNKKFILANLLDATPDLYGDECVQLLWEAMAERDTLVRRQARYVLGRFLPRHTAHSFGFDEKHDRASQLSKTRVEAHDHALRAEQLALVQVAGYELRKVLRETYELARVGAPMVRDAAGLVTGRLYTHRTVQALAEVLMKDDRVVFGPAFALAEIGDRPAREALYNAAWTAGQADPDVYMLLASVPTRESFTILQQHEEKSSKFARANIAHALSSFPANQARPLIEKIVARGEDWPTAFVLDAIASWGDASFFELVRKVFESPCAPFIRAQAARAIGSFRSEAAVEYCRRLMGDADPIVQAAALDGLIRNASDLNTLQGDVVPLITSPSPRIRVRTMLLLAHSDPPKLQAMLAAAMSSSSTKERRAAAYVLGFLAGPEVEELLASMALDDSSSHVRTHAIRSLGALDTRSACDLLVSVARLTREPGDIKEVVRALSAVSRVHVGGALDALVAVKDPASGVHGQAQLLRGVGLLAALAGRPPPDVLLSALADPEPGLVSGALEGLRRMGYGVPLDAVKKLEGHADPKVRMRAAGTRLVAGDLTVSKQFVEMLTSGQETIQMSALNMLLEFACLIPLAVAGDRFESLCSTLRERGSSPEFGQFQEGARSLSQSLIEMRPVKKPEPIDNIVEESIRTHQTGRQMAIDLQTLRLAYRAGPGSRHPKTPLTAAQQWKAAAMAAFRWPLNLMWIPFFVIGFFMWRAFDAPPPGEQPVIIGPKGLARGTFGPVEINGVLTITSPGGKTKIMRPDTVISAGDQLETDGKASVTLADSLGNAIKMAPSSKVSFTGAEPMVWSPTEVRYSFDDVRGDVTFDFRRMNETKVRLGSSMFTLGRGAARVEDDPPGRKITQTMGEGTLVESTGQLIRLLPGKTATILAETAPAASQ